VCQIFHVASYQKVEKITKSPQNIPNGHETYQMVLKYSKRPQNIQILSIPRHSKIYSKGFFVFKIYHLATLLY
jgi:anionic cell wall polymer biosynthesis LytR-Cps2A-Psr (LCP) family protein